MGTLSYTLPTVGNPDTTEDPLVRTALSSLLTLVNGNIDSANLSSSASISAAQLASTVADSLALTQGATARRGYALVSTSESTSSSSAVDLATVGPDVTITCPSGGGLVFLLPYAELLNSAGAAIVTVYRDNSPLLVNGVTGPPTISGGTASFVAMLPNAGGPLVLPETAGSHTYRLKYKSNGTAASFRNRQLWAWVMGF